MREGGIDGAIERASRFFGELGRSDGVPAEEIDEACATMGWSMPSALRHIYLRTGHRADMHQSQDHLISPKRLRAVDGFVVFYEEHQRVCMWGIPLEGMNPVDPPVYVHLYGEGGWSLAFASVTQFFEAQCVWQAIGGGLPHVGIVLAGPMNEPKAIGRRVRARARSIQPPYVVAKGTEAWLFGDAVFGMASVDYFGIAAMERESFLHASALLGITNHDWDYASSHDA